MIVLSAAVEWYEEEEEECADAERLANEGSSDNVVEDFLLIGKPFATFFERTRQTNKTISKLVESKRKLVFRREQ